LEAGIVRVSFTLPRGASAILLVPNILQHHIGGLLHNAKVHSQNVTLLWR
jgi:hypothetical protein